MYYDIESLEFEDGELIEVIFSRTWHGRCYCTEEVDWDDVDKVVILPCIGEVDKNRKEIYFGDIVRRDMPLAMDDPAYGHYWDTGVLSYDDGRFYVEFGDDDLNYDWNELEVIGNVYESRELL